MALDALELEAMAADETQRSGGPGFSAGYERLRLEWEALDETLFRDLRARVRGSPSPGAAFRDLLDAHLPGWRKYAPDGAQGPGDIHGYGILDAFLNGLLHPFPVPEPLVPCASDMVPYQKTPARILVQMIERASPRPSDRFCDVGAGLGQASLLVHLLTGITASGVEIDPAYVGYARACAADLGLSGVRFECLDAREADYSGYSLLFLYTPFRGGMLAEVLDRIRRQCRPGARLFTYGPCTAAFAGQPWLRPLEPVPGNGRDLAVFSL
jgi:hypothetical protein